MKNISSSEIIEIINHSYDEIFIYDDKYNIVYVNSAVERHYGFKSEEMIGKTYFDFFKEESWDISILPTIYEQKKPISIKQTTNLNIELLTIAIPIFDESNNIKYVIMNVRDNPNDIKLLNPHYISDSRNRDFPKPIFQSKLMKDLLLLIERIAQIDASCIFTGETGTGKTFFANYMHKASPRKDKAFISINCANLSNDLFESELFGYKKGAFTGASSRGKEGLILAANQGTLFLDEIAELSLQSQAKILTVLQEKRFLPVGSTEYVDVDVRIIVATNRDLKEMVRLGTFREDLYYRLNLIDIYIPPLRERREEIPLFIKQFSKETFDQYGIYPNFAEETIEILTNASWKGNIRELKHTIERLALTIDKGIIQAKDLPNDFFGIHHKDPSLISLKQGNLDDQINELTEKIVKEGYKKHNTSRKLAQYLEISQTRANNLIRRYVKEEDL